MKPPERTALMGRNNERDALEIFEAGLNAARPEFFFRELIKKNGSRLICANEYVHISIPVDDIRVAALGKAACSMYKAFTGISGTVKNRLIITKDEKCDGAINAGHPLPDQASLQAGKMLYDFFADCDNDKTIVFLLSGGASALAEYPCDGISLDELAAFNEVLIKSGMPIEKVNTLRRSISEIKGGRLAAASKANIYSFIISDVRGDSIEYIGSGPTAADISPGTSPMELIREYDLCEAIPGNIMNLLKNYSTDTINSGAHIVNIISANNQKARLGAEKKAQKLGYEIMENKYMYGRVQDAADYIIGKATAIQSGQGLIYGGETTLKVKGRGKGGRNTELALRCLNELHKTGIILLSCGTDGSDGPTDAAGACFRANGGYPYELIASYLENNDSYNFFNKFGGLVKTGPTGTNVGDILVILKV